ncbi:MAG: hypothetical protein KC609_20540 [Myxococcales bacterium]|nr:hypothetical protein [Myxococcales bacterium]
MTWGVLGAVLAAGILDFLGESQQKRSLQWLATGLILLSAVAWGFVHGRLLTMAFFASATAGMLRIGLLLGEREALAAGAVQVVAALALLGTEAWGGIAPSLWSAQLADAAQGAAMVLAGWSAATAIERSAKRRDGALFSIALAAALFTVAFPSWVAALSSNASVGSPVAYFDPRLVQSYIASVPMRFVGEPLRWVALVAAPLVAAAALVGWLFRVSQASFARGVAFAAAAVALILIGQSLSTPWPGFLSLSSVETVVGREVLITAHPAASALRAGFVTASPLVAAWIALAYVGLFLARGYSSTDSDAAALDPRAEALSPPWLAVAAALVFLALLFSSMAAYDRAGMLDLDQRRTVLLIATAVTSCCALYLRFTRGEAGMVRALVTIGALCLGLDALVRLS